MRALYVLPAAATALALAAAPTTVNEPLRGLSDAAALAAAYDAILDADFAAAPEHLETVCDQTPSFCLVMDAVSLWWQIALDPRDRSRDPIFTATVEAAIESAEEWTGREPLRAEAWFARGAAYGVRAQFRVARGQRLAAARDGKRILQALERALELDPTMHDAKFGMGLYRYYADVAPATLRMLRWFLLLPGGDRDEGLQQMLEARALGRVMRGEADYQLHQIYLWYEDRPRDALAIVHDLQRRYPHNPLFYLIEAEIEDVYFHDEATSAALLEALAIRAEHGDVHAPRVALRRARTALNALQARRARKPAAVLHAFDRN